MAANSTHRRFAAMLLFSTLAPGVPVRAADHFGAWPEGKSPQEIGRRVAERFVASPHANFGNPGPPNDITYPETCVWWGALTFAKLAGDRGLTNSLVKRFEPLFGPEKQLVPNPVHVDATVFGAVPLEIHLQTGERRYLDLGLPIADRQWAKPAADEFAKMSPTLREWVERGLSWQTRLWIDDMFMITMVQTQAFRASGDLKYIDRTADEMVFYLDRLQQPNGLFFHAVDVPFFWGRGNGWMAAGMTELLRAMPDGHRHRARIMEGYRRMMASLMESQNPDGMWRQLVDDPNSWPESSCTGMFTYAMITGVRKGWLPPDAYGPAARKGWLALTGYINGNGEISDTCIGTNKLNSRNYYLNRPRATGDLHGQAPVLWCASAMLR